MRPLAPAFILSSLVAAASGVALAQSTTSTTGDPSKATSAATSSAQPGQSTAQAGNTATQSGSSSGSAGATASSTTDANAVVRTQTTRFISRLDAPVRACVERCISGGTLQGGVTLGADGSTWTFDQFYALYDEPTRICFNNCGISTTGVVAGTGSDEAKKDGDKKENVARNENAATPATPAAPPARAAPGSESATPATPATPAAPSQRSSANNPADVGKT